MSYCELCHSDLKAGDHEPWCSHGDPGERPPEALIWEKLEDAVSAQPYVLLFDVLAKVVVGEPSVMGRKSVTMHTWKPTGERVRSVVFAYDRKDAVLAGEHAETIRLQALRITDTQRVRCVAAEPPVTAEDYELVAAELRARTQTTKGEV